MYPKEKILKKIRLWHIICKIETMRNKAGAIEMVAWSRGEVSHPWANCTPKNLHDVGKRQSENARRRTSEHKIVQTALAYLCKQHSEKRLGRNRKTQYNSVYFRFWLTIDFYNFF